MDAQSTVYGYDYKGHMFQTVWLGTAAINENVLDACLVDGRGNLDEGSCLWRNRRAQVRKSIRKNLLQVLPFFNPKLYPKNIELM